VDELESILYALHHLPLRTETDPAKVRERMREKEIVKRRLGTLVAASSGVEKAIAKSLEDINGVLGDPRSFDRLDALLSEQAYRLAFWRVATDEINYRRFFDINDLAAIRVEEPLVFHAIHELPLRYVSLGIITGFRLDHLDGLFSPSRYLQDLRRACRAALRTVTAEPTKKDDLYIIAEKIIEGDEALREGFPIEGTTGYGFLNMLGSVFVDPKSAHELALSASSY
jgi:(1->4)-alpha-D-glucan 1-alpha-D-glucosylmutase